MGLKFALVGGDLRNVKLASFFKKRGCEVYTYGLSQGESQCSDLQEAVTRGDFVVGPMPFTLDGRTVNAPFHYGELELSRLMEALPTGSVLLGGKIPASFIAQGALKGVQVVDILDREDMAVLNAVPTAEGAIQIAMEELPVTLHDCAVLVLGFGKVASALAERLAALGAKVTVCVRKSRDRALGSSRGYGVISFGDLVKEVGHFTLVYNTVPALVIDRPVLEAMGPGTLVVDLASKPGGVDFTLARELGISAVQALSLPGKVAPETSGQIMGEVIFNVLQEFAGEGREYVNGG